MPEPETTTAADAAQPTGLTDHDLDAAAGAAATYLPAVQRTQLAAQTTSGAAGAYANSFTCIPTALP